ncbi:MAG TPA: sulfur carrier protein ThiS [Acidimicrobiales bacterium]|jgi:sulfur carrier protein|nr:sulfur carrier protein ThiS [Acidimicrobiales bacterium]
MSGDASVHLSVNGEPWHGPGPTTLSDIVARWCQSPKGVAVARNGDVVPKSQWAVTEVVNGDRIEIVAAAAGG